jgi:excisionase family DNA binding protein
MKQPTVSEARELLTTEQAAKMLNVREVTVRSWLGQRKLAAYKLGRSWRISKLEIERYLAESLIPRR